MQKNTERKLKRQLIRNINAKVRTLDKRIFAHAQTMYPIDDLALFPPDYGLGIIPRLTSIVNNNEEAQNIINESLGIRRKLSLIKKLLSKGNLLEVLKCLSNNQYLIMSEQEIEEFLSFKIEV